MEAALRALLVSHAPLLERMPAESIVWNHWPQGMQRPGIVMFRISGALGINMGGSDGLLDARVQIDAQAPTVTSMWDIRSVVMSLLHGYRDDTLRIFALGERQTSEDLAGALIHRCSMDFNVWARTTA